MNGRVVACLQIRGGVLVIERVFVEVLGDALRLCCNDHPVSVLAVAEDPSSAWDKHCDHRYRRVQGNNKVNRGGRTGAR
jgi:hypothetical protein